ncbi:LCL3 [Enterospora canceri]|uniref:LCL3 n=1 Tax=Enterospora canceri TaxID=1081671 RepID=A0A1Y1S4L0_9MICR|nr:LCL3 [Enterospora canceri]
MTSIGLVTKVIDGDTIRVKFYKDQTNLKDLTDEIKIRFAGMDTPELNETNGKEPERWAYDAKNFVEKIIGNTNVKVEFLGIDRFNRDIGIIHLINGTDLNQLLIEGGYAKIYKGNNQQYGRKLAEYQEAENMARMKRLRLWQ